MNSATAKQLNCETTQPQDNATVNTTQLQKQHICKTTQLQKNRSRNIA